MGVSQPLTRVKRKLTTIQFDDAQSRIKSLMDCQLVVILDNADTALGQGVASPGNQQGQMGRRRQAAALGRKTFRAAVVIDSGGLHWRSVGRVTIGNAAIIRDNNQGSPILAIDPRQGQGTEAIGTAAGLRHGGTAAADRQ